MRIALVHSRYASAEPSGENAVVDNEVAALSRAGFDVRLFSRPSDELEGEPMRKVRAFARVATGRGFSPAAELEAWKPDVVHVHNLFPNFGTSWLDKVECPLVHTVHNYRSVCAAATLFRDGHPCTSCIDGSRVAALRHRCYRGSVGATLPLVLSQRRQLARDPRLRPIDRAIFLSERTRDLYMRLGFDADRAEVWPNFLPDGRRTFVQGSLAREGPFVFVGRLRPEKGILDLIDRWPRSEPLLVIGDGPAAEQVRAAAAGRSVHVLGAVPPADVARALQGARGLVIPSKVHEQFPMVYLEALAAGIPVLAFETNVVADLVRRDGTGVVASWTSPLEPALRALRLIGAEAAQQAMNTRYSEAAYVRRAARLYASLIADRP